MCMFAFYGTMPDVLAGAVFTFFANLFLSDDKHEFLVENIQQEVTDLTKGRKLPFP